MTRYRRLIACTLGGLLSGIVCGLALPAAHGQTAAEKAACRADVFRLCSAGAIAAAGLGDRAGIYACFKQHRRELSSACDRVLRTHGY